MKGNLVVTERFIRTLENEIYKYMIAVSKMCLLIDWMKMFVNVL